MLDARDRRQAIAVGSNPRFAVADVYRATVNALASALEIKDTGTRAHSERVQRYAVELARVVDPALAESRSLGYGFLLHDVGKIAVPDRILRKPGPLTANERRAMQGHTLLGEAMLARVALLAGAGIEVVRCHHERWDGSGYPDRLGGPSIPVGARIFAVADALDAMTTDRPYRRARSWAAARDEIETGSGRQFDPRVVEAFFEREAALRAIQHEFSRRA